jgi:hypothetical protein
MQNRRPIAFVVGHFQADNPTWKHERLIERAYQHAGCLSKNLDLILVVLDTPLKQHRNHPLPFHARQGMLSIFFNIPEEHIIPLPTAHNDHALSCALDRIIDRYRDNRRAIIFVDAQGKMARRTYTTKRHEVVQVELPNVPGANHGESHQLSDPRFVQRRLARNQEFRLGFMAAMATTTPKVHPAVDLAIIDIEKESVVLGRKKCDGNLLRFPGTMIRPLKDKQDKDAIARILTHECGNIQISNLRLLEAHTIKNEWPHKEAGDLVRTNFWMAHLASGNPCTVSPKILDAVGTYPLNQLLKHIVPQHRALAHLLLEMIT